jgi:hypothetical protein
MAANNQVRVTLTAVTNDLRRGVDEASGTLLQFQRNASRAQGAARIFGDALTSLGGAGKGLASGLSNVLAGFATGGLIGAAIGGVNALVGSIKETKAEAERAAEAQEKAAKRMADAWQDAADRVGRTRAEAGGGDPRAFDIVTKTGRQIAEAEAELTKAQGEEAAARKVIRDNEATAYRTSSKTAIVSATAQLDELTKRIAGLKKQIADLREAAAFEEANLDPVTIKTGNPKKSAQDQLERNKAADKAVRERVEAELRLEEEAANERGEILAFQIDRETKARNEARQQEKQAAEKALQEAERRAEQEAQAWGTAASQIGYSLGVAFASGTSGAEKMKAVYSSTAGMVIDLATTQIMAAAAASAAEAYKSQAGIPVVGPFLGAAAAVTALGIVKGFLSNMPGREMGGPVLAGMPYIVGEKRAEVFVPDSNGTILPDAGAVGGGGLNVNVYGAMDGEDVYRTLRRNERSVARVMRRMSRARRG